MHVCVCDRGAPACESTAKQYSSRRKMHHTKPMCAQPPQMNPSGKASGPPPAVKKVLSLFGSGREEDRLVGYLSFLKIGPQLLRFLPGARRGKGVGGVFWRPRVSSGAWPRGLRCVWPLRAAQTRARPLQRPLHGCHQAKRRATCATG